MTPKLRVKKDRQYLSDATIKRAAFAKNEPYRIVDRDLPGFYLDVRADGKTLRLKLEQDGKTKGFSWAWPTFKADEAREKAQEIRMRRDRGEPLDGPNDAITLVQAWDSYKALLKKKERSDGTIEFYRSLFDRCLKPLHDRALRDITRQDVIKLHNDITKAGHSYMANGVARVGHALYNHAAKDLEKPLPALNPFRGRNLHNKEKRAEVDFEEGDLPGWFKQLTALPNPIWREWYFLVMLTGLRRSSISNIRLEDIHLDANYIDIRKTKGGVERRFKVPISKPMRRSLQRLIRAGAPLRERFQHCAPWAFPSPSAKSGHVTEPGTQNIDTTSKDQRHIFILFATGAGVGETHRQVLTNHKIPRSVHNEYMNVPAMFDQLCEAQDRISAYILKHLGKGAEATLERLLRRDLTPKGEAEAA